MTKNSTVAASRSTSLTPVEAAVVVAVVTALAAAAAAIVVVAEATVVVAAEATIKAAMVKAATVNKALDMVKPPAAIVEVGTEVGLRTDRCHVFSSSH